MKRKVVLLLSCLFLVIVFTGCSEASKVSTNVSQEADNFNVLRRFAVINTRTDKVEFELIGAFSLQHEENNQVCVVVEREDGSYLKHIIGLNKDSIYVVEDLGGAKVNKYKYEINYIPESIIPFDVVNKD